MNTVSPPILFVGGRVFTEGMSDSAPLGVLIENGHISFVGEDTYLKTIAPQAEVIDLKGGLLIPSFTDAHLHPITGGLDRLNCDLSSATTREEALTLIHAHATTLDPDAWVLGGGWQRSLFPRPEGPNRADLDAVTGGRPALLHSYDRHGAWVNTEALSRASVTSQTADPAKGAISRAPDGTPSGFLNEQAVTLVSSLIPQPSPGQMRQALKLSQDLMFRYGITGWQDALVGDGLGMADPLRTYIDTAANGQLRARVTAALWWDYNRGLEQLPTILARRDTVNELGSSRLRADVVKFMIDGIGHDFLTADAFQQALLAIETEGLSAHVHACSDQAVHIALDAFAEARRRDPNGRFRHQVAHLFVVQKDDLRRFAELGVTANVQALWGGSDPHYDIFVQPPTDPDHQRFSWPIGQLVRAGADIAAGSDWPVSSADPIDAIRTITNWENGARVPAEGRVDLATMLAAYTAGSARATGRGAFVGRLSPGMAADLAVFDADPFAVGIHNVNVISTWLDGVQVSGI